MKTLIFLFTLFTSLSLFATERPYVIAVIDTGFGFDYKGQEATLCDFGHKDFTRDQQFVASYGFKDQVPLDLHGHGTNVAGLIWTYAKMRKTNFCLVILKTYPYLEVNRINFDPAQASADAIAHAIAIKADMINNSGGGGDMSYRESSQVRRFIDGGGVFVAAAGNDNRELGKNYGYYPAMADKRTVVVGALFDDGTKAIYSNFGKRVNRWEFGHEQRVFDIMFSGTSQACAIASGKLAGTKGERYDTSKKRKVFKFKKIKK